MPGLEDIRQKYPQYNDMSDGQFADAFHSKFYSDMPRDLFNQKLGIQAEPPKDPSWSQVPMEAVKNLPASAGRFARDLAQPIIHPIETNENLFNLGMGILQKSSPIMQGMKAGGLAGEGDYEKYADAVGKFFMDRYGSMDAIKKTLATDPVGVASDAATVLTGGGGALARAPGTLGKVGEAVGTVGRAVDPLSVVPAAGKAAAEIVGGLGTHTGADALKIGAQAGREGGAASDAFLANLRGSEPMEETVNAARGALQNIRKDRGAAYRSGMADVGKDKAVLDFNKIDDALTEISGVKTFKGQNISPKTQAIREEIGKAIIEWKALDPKEFHTVEGMDALKQKIGDIRDATQYGTPDRLVADKAYNAIKSTITAQAPAYAKVMKGYEEASKQIKEIEASLTGKPNASIEQALKKLQATLRDNVNTSFGRKKELAQFLVKAGAPQLMERLAGQALKPWTPRGLAKMVGTEILAAGAGMFGAGATGGGAAVLGVAPFMSPRLMGEAAHGIGAMSSAVSRGGAQSAFQGGRITGQLEPREMVKQDAKAALRDKPEDRFTKAEIASMREVARGAASVDTVLAVKKAIERSSYGGPM